MAAMKLNTTFGPPATEVWRNLSGVAIHVCDDHATEAAVAQLYRDIDCAYGFPQHDYDILARYQRESDAARCQHPSHLVEWLNDCPYRWGDPRRSLEPHRGWLEAFRGSSWWRAITQHGTRFR